MLFRSVLSCNICLIAPEVFEFNPLILFGAGRWGRRRGPTGQDFPLNALNGHDLALKVHDFAVNDLAGNFPFVLNSGHPPKIPTQHTRAIVSPHPVSNLSPISPPPLSPLSPTAPRRSNTDPAATPHPSITPTVRAVLGGLPVQYDCEEHRTRPHARAC